MSGGERESREGEKVKGERRAEKEERVSRKKEIKREEERLKRPDPGIELKQCRMNSRSGSMCGGNGQVAFCVGILLQTDWSGERKAWKERWGGTKPCE